MKRVKEQSDVAPRAALLQTSSHETDQVLPQHGLQELVPGFPRVRQLQALQSVADSPPQPESHTSHAATASGHKGVAQRVRNLVNMDDGFRPLILQILRANPMLRDLWHWVRDHPTITLTVLDGNSNHVVAPIGSRQISLTLSPAGLNDDPHRMLGSIHHELTLHLLPWARPLMLLELNAAIQAGQGLEDPQVRRMCTVLSPIAASPQELIANVRADIANKGPTKFRFGGNHSDMHLWALHLQGVRLMANRVAPAAATQFVTRELAAMVLPLSLTGQVDDAVERGPGAYAQVVAELNALAAFRPDDVDLRAQFDVSHAWVLARMQTYEHHLRG